MTGAWRIAWRNLARNRRRNLATASAIALGYAGILLLGGYAIRVERFLRINSVYLQHTGHVSIYKKDGLERSPAQPSKYALSAADQQVLRDLIAEAPGVERVGRYLVGMGLAGNGCKTAPFVATGVEFDVEAKLQQHPDVVAISGEIARPLRGNPVATYGDVPGAAAMSTGLARLLGKSKVKDELAGVVAPAMPDCAASNIREQLAQDSNIQLAALTWGGSLSAIDAELVTIVRTAMAETENTTIVTSLATLQRLYETDAVTYMAVYLADRGQAGALAKDLETKAAARGLAVSVYPYDHDVVGAYYVGTMQFLLSVVFFIGMLVVLVVVLSVLNATTLSVLERTRELGTLRSLGFARHHVVGLYGREAALLAALAMVAGLCIGLVAAAVVNGADIRFSPPGIVGTVQLLLMPTWWLALVVGAVMLPMSVMAAWLAVRFRVRASVAELLTAVSG